MKKWNRSALRLGLLVTGLAVSDARAQTIYSPYAFTNFAGQPGTPGAADGVGGAAQFNIPHSVAVDGAGSLFVGDTFNHVIRKVTPGGEVTTIVGSPGNKGYGDGVGTAQAARFNSPVGLSADAAGNLYVGDGGNQTIRRVSPGRVVTTLAGQVGVTGSLNGTGSGATFNGPNGTAVDSTGNVFVADLVNRTIRKITPGGTVSVFAGGTGLQGTNDGTGTVARFTSPLALAVDAADNLYVADQGGNTIRKITPGAVVTTLAGMGKVSGTNDGVGGMARFFGPQGVAVDGSGNVFVSDSGNNTIRKITPGGTVTTLAGVGGENGGTDGTNDVARFKTPRGIGVDGGGNIYVADSANSTIRKLVLNGSNCVVTTLAGASGQNGSLDGAGSAARFHFPYGLAVTKAGNIYAVDRSNDDVREITPQGVVTTYVGLSGSVGSEDGTGAGAQLYGPEDLVVDPAGNIYVVEFFNNTVRKIAPSGTNWVVTTLAGCATCPSGTNDGVGSVARFDGPFGLTRDPSGNLYVADTSNRTIRKLALSGTDWVVTTFVGTPGLSGAKDGTGNAAILNAPHDLAADSSGNLYFSDGFAIRKATPAGVVTTLAGCPPPACVDAMGSVDGPGAVARFGLPRGVAIDGAGNLYVADAGNDTIRKLSPSGGDWMVTTLAGVPGQVGATDGTGSESRFNAPTGIAVNGLGTVYVVDSAEYRISRGTPVGASGVQFDTADGGLILTNNSIQMRVSGPSSGTVILEASSDLSAWTPIQTNVLTSGSAMLLVSVDSSPARFFRLRLGP